GVDLYRGAVGAVGRADVQAQALIAGDRPGYAGAGRSGAGCHRPDEALGRVGAVAVLRGDRGRAGSVGGGGAGDDAGGGDRQAGWQAGGRIGQRLAAGGVLAAEGDLGRGAAGQAGLRAGAGQGDRGAELAGRYGQGAGQRQARARVADRDRVVAGTGSPRVRATAPVLEALLGQGEGDGGRCPGGQVDPLEALELKWRLPGGGRVGDVELGDVRARADAGVGHGGGDGGRTARGERADVQVAEREGRVGQAVPEREQRRQALAGVPAVADVDALGVLHSAAGARPLGGGAGGNLRQRGREADGQVPGRVVAAEQDVSDRGAVPLAGVPGLEHALHRGEPGHGAPARGTAP